MLRFIAFWLVVLGLCTPCWGQRKAPFPLSVRVDTTLYTKENAGVEVGGKPILAFPLAQGDIIVDLFFNQTNANQRPVLASSRDFIILDTFRLEDSAVYRARIQFSDLGRAGLVPLVIGSQEKNGGVARSQSLDIYPYIPTGVFHAPLEEELFLGEEKVLELAAIHAANVKAEGIWTTLGAVNYKVFSDGGKLKLSLVTTELGHKELKVPIKTVRPVVANGKLTYDLPPVVLHLTAKTSRTAFLSFDKKEVTLDFEQPKGIEIQVDRHSLLQVRKTYRIETTAEPGGAFVGELYTRSNLSNDKVLAWLRPFALHNPSQGYLYLKDGDDLRFITNLSITEKTRIAKCMVRHAGGDFSDNLAVYPGEEVDVRIEGTGLEKVDFLFEGAQNIKEDSALATPNVSVFGIHVPLTISKRKLVIYKGKDPTGFELSVKEFQNPRPLDFVFLNWGGGEREVGKLTQPILFDKNIPELTITANPQKIDANGKLYGKQYLIAEINIFNQKKDLIETRRIENIVIAPGDESPRSALYDQTDCLKGPLNLNQYLAHKTFDLPDWATIEITIKHNPFKYNGDLGYSQKVEIFLQKHVTFDIDVSFPAGLQIFSLSDHQYNGLNGISLAVLPQLSFYRPDKIAKLQPYRVGAGFIALNAFDFTNSSPESRDIGAVVLGSLFPTRTGSRFSFPLYGGFGYKLRAGQFFFLFGPGIQVRL